MHNQNACFSHWLLLESPHLDFNCVDRPPRTGKTKFSDHNRLEETTQERSKSRQPRSFEQIFDTFHPAIKRHASNQSMYFLESTKRYLLGYVLKCERNVEFIRTIILHSLFTWLMCALENLINISHTVLKYTNGICTQSFIYNSFFFGWLWLNEFHTFVKLKST